ncbi:MAG: type II toxin-antitoxin system PemK/MazF family toxin, partial [Acidimicrobiia bacterium]
PGASATLGGQARLWRARGVVGACCTCWSSVFGDCPGRRPVCVLTRDPAIGVLSAVACAPLTRTIRGIRSEVEIGPHHGLAEPCAINCDNLITVPLELLDDEPVGSLDAAARAGLDRALRYALDIVH